VWTWARPPGVALSVTERSVGRRDPVAGATAVAGVVFNGTSAVEAGPGSERMSPHGLRTDTENRPGNRTVEFL
jgi:hypothetical protein